VADLRIKRIGYFGKMPKSGDFVSRNVDPVIKDGFDRWLQESITESQAQLKESWLSAFLTAPIWRFLLLDQFGASKAMLGIMIPSVDKVGRYFPLSVFIEISGLQLDHGAMVICDEILHEFEDLLLGVLSEELDQDFFDYQLGLAARRLADKPLQNPNSTGSKQFGEMEGLAHRLLDLQGSGGTLWWTEGSDHRQPDTLLYQAMPNNTVFASFLRDPNHFRDLEWAWETARDLNSSQQNNASIDALDKCLAGELHIISHRGADHGQHNTTAAVFSSQSQAFTVSDGRFGAGHFAMASRFVAQVVPTLLSRTQKDGYTSRNEDQELDRIASFLMTKFVGVPHPNLLSPLSFASVFMDEPENARLLSTGDYLCFQKGRHGVVQLLGSHYGGGDGDQTLRQDQAGHYKTVSLKLEAGDRLLLTNSAFDTPHLRDELYEAIAAPSVSSAAKSLFHNATIKGVPGNLVIAVLDYAERAPTNSKLQPDLGIE
jgi:type VI secretion system protein ImpM